MDQELRDRLTKLETVVYERGKAHADRAADLKKWMGDEFRSISGKFTLLFEKVDIVTANKTNIRWLTWSQRILWAVLIIGGLLSNFGDQIWAKMIGG